MTLVREGDPEGALVLVLGRFAPLDETVTLSALLASRLAEVAPRVEVLTRLSGITVVAPLESTAAAHQVVVQVDRAIRAEVSGDELARPRYKYQLERLLRSSAQHVSRAERLLCAGESGGGAEGGRSVEQLRKLAFAEDRARFGAVGSTDAVAAVDAAIRTLEPWPKGPTMTTPDSTENGFKFQHTGRSTPRLRVVIRTGLVKAGLAAERLVASPSSDLREMLAAFPTSLRLTEVAFSPLPVGSCLALGISTETLDTVPSIDDAVGAGNAAIEMLRNWSDQAAPDEVLTSAVVEQADPRRAAELAAQLSLARDAHVAQERFWVEIETATGSAPTAAQQKALEEALAVRRTPSPLPLLRASERGQGTLHAMIASPCASWTESPKTAGATGLLLRSLVARHAELNGVRLEPWVSPNGAGLMARTTRVSHNESPEAQARRLGDSLGRVLVTGRLEAPALWATRQELLTLLGPGPRPALWRAIATLSPRYPSLVIPDGQFSSVESLSLTSLQERRMELLRLPLRIAVIENESARQSEAVRAAVTRWLAPLRGEPRDCPELVHEESFSGGEYRIESRTPDPNDAGLTLVLPLPVDGPMTSQHAMLLERLLGGPAGWIAQRFRASNLSATVDAKAIGGSLRRGLVIVIGAQPTALDAAASSTMELFRELGSGSIPPGASIAGTLAQVELAERLRRLEPSSRLEDLWLSRERFARVDETSLRAYLRRTFGNQQLTQVRSIRTTTATPTGRSAR